MIFRPNKDMWLILDAPYMHLAIQIMWKDLTFGLKN